MNRILAAFAAAALLAALAAALTWEPLTHSGWTGWRHTINGE